MIDKVQKIRQEIERLQRNLNECISPNNPILPGTLNVTFNRLKDFIDSLPEEPANEDLEEDSSFEKLLQEIYIKYDKKISIESLLDIASHFAEWQKEKDEQEGKVLFEKSSGDCPKELIDIIDKEFGIDGRDVNDNPLNGFEDWQCGMILNGPAISRLVKLGVEWQKQQMMKDAVEGLSCTYSNQEGTFLHIKQGIDTKDGDKIKIIIIKSEQQ
jgi:hypothetical protein